MTNTIHCFQYCDNMQKWLVMVMGTEQNCLTLTKKSPKFA